MAGDSSRFKFSAAVERPLSAVFQTGEGSWEGHDYRVEVVVERLGLDGFDVVMDFRDLEAHLDRLLAPLQGRLLSEAGLDGPVSLARRLLADLAPAVCAGARLAEVALTDGTGRRLGLKP